VAVAADSPLTVAGAAPVLHRTSLSHRAIDASTRRDEPPTQMPDEFRCSPGKYREGPRFERFEDRFQAIKSL
jgi:hypothetical protein